MNWETTCKFPATLDENVSMMAAANANDRRRMNPSIFNGLDIDLYSRIRSQILAPDPLPPVDKIFNIIQQEENYKKVIIGRYTCNEYASKGARKSTATSLLVIHILGQPQIW